MDELINKQVTLNAFCDKATPILFVGKPTFIVDYIKVLESIPSVKPQEPKTGHWINIGCGQECSKCHEIQYGYDNHRFYCANCGIKMESEVK